jgi:hypothetical protein
MSSMGCASDMDGASCGAKWKWGQLVELEGAIYRVEAVNRAVGGGGRGPATSDQRWFLISFGLSGFVH